MKNKTNSNLWREYAQKIILIMLLDILNISLSGKIQGMSKIFAFLG